MEHLIENEYCKFWTERGVLYGDYHEIDEVDFRIADLCVKMRIEASGEMSYPCLFDITKVKKWAPEARKLLASQEASELMTACALLVNSPVVQMIANFYIFVNKPLVPTRWFTDRRKAVKWLADFRVPNEV